MKTLEQLFEELTGEEFPEGLVVPDVDDVLIDSSEDLGTNDGQQEK